MKALLANTLRLATLAPILLTSLYAVDANNDGMDDTWQQRYAIGLFTGSQDPDQDGRVNLVESKNFSNPYQPDTNGLGMVIIRDLNPVDGLHDPWQQQFGINAAQKWDDPDSDLRTNYEESLTMSNPFVSDTPYSLMANRPPTVERPGPSTFIARMPESAQGRRYLLEVSDTLLPGSWTAATMSNAGSPYQWGTGAEISAEALTGSSPRKFFRWRIDDPDTDGDYLSDWVEMQMGLNVNNPDSDGDGYFDGAEIAANTSASNAYSNPEASFNSETADRAFPTYLTYLLKHVKNTWEQRWSNNIAYPLAAELTWSDEATGYGTAPYQVYEPRWTSKLQQLSYPFSTFTAWKVLGYSSLIGDCKLIDFRSPNHISNDYGDLNLNYRQLSTRTLYQTNKQPWNIMQRYVVVRHKRYEPPSQPIVESIESVRVENLIIFKGASESTTRIASEPPAINYTTVSDYIEGMGVYTNPTLALDDISPRRWIMLPQGEPRQVQIYSSSTIASKKYQAVGGGITPNTPINGTTTYVNFSSSEIGDEGLLKTGYYTGSSPVVWAGEAVLDRVVSFTVKPSRVINLVVRPIAYLDTNGISTNPPYIPSKIELEDFLNSAFVPQTNISFVVTILPAIPVHYDVGLGPVVNQGNTSGANDGRFQIFQGQWSKNGWFSAEELAIFNGAPPLSSATINIYLVHTPVTMWYARYSSEQDEETGKLGDWHQNGLDGGVKWTVLAGYAKTAQAGYGPIGFINGSSVMAPTWVIAHEVGHLLGLPHTVDDDIPGGVGLLGALNNADNEMRLMTGHSGPKRWTYPTRLNKAEWDAVHTFTGFAQ